MGHTIHVNTGGTTVSAEMFQPSGTPNGAAVVIAYGSDGMREPWAAMIREYASDLAALNFTVVIPDYLAATASTPGFSVFSEIPAHFNQWLNILRKTLGQAKALPGVSAARVGLLGFSLGGFLCLRVREESKSLVEFFAPEFPELGGIGPCRTRLLNAQIHHGTADYLVPFENAKRVQDSLTTEGTACELFRYEGAGHGFIALDANNATAQRSSKTRALEFFKQKL